MWAGTRPAPTGAFEGEDGAGWGMWAGTRPAPTGAFEGEGEDGAGGGTRAGTRPAPTGAFEGEGDGRGSGARAGTRPAPRERLRGKGKTRRGWGDEGRPAPSFVSRTYNPAAPRSSFDGVSLTGTRPDAEKMDAQGTGQDYALRTVVSTALISRAVAPVNPHEFKLAGP